MLTRSSPIIEMTMDAGRDSRDRLEDHPASSISSDRSRFAGRLAGLTQVIFAALLGGVSALASGPEPGFMPRWAVLFIVFALPGVVGLIGTQAQRPSLLVAAGVSSAVGAVVAFSGVTLIFLVPAVLFLYGAIRLSSSVQPVGGEGWAGGLAQVGLAAAVAVLLVGAGASAILNTDAACWTEYRTPTGTRIELMPYTSGGVQVPDGATSVSCGTGLISARGVGLAGLLAGSALGLAAIAARRRKPELGVPAGASAGA